MKLTLGFLLAVFIVAQAKPLVKHAETTKTKTTGPTKRNHLSSHSEQAILYPAPNTWRLNSKVESPSAKDKVGGISQVIKGTVKGIPRTTVFEVDQNPEDGAPSNPDPQTNEIDDNPEKEILPVEANSYEPKISQKDSESEYRATTPSAILQQEQLSATKPVSPDTPQPENPSTEDAGFASNTVNQGEEHPAIQFPSSPVENVPIMSHGDQQQTPSVRNLTNILQTYGLSEQRDILKPKEKIKSIFTAVPADKKRVQVHVDYPKPKFLEFVQSPGVSGVFGGSVGRKTEEGLGNVNSIKNETTPGVRGAIEPKNNTESSMGRGHGNKIEDKAASTRGNLEMFQDDLHYEDVNELKKPEVKKEETNKNRAGVLNKTKKDPWSKHEHAVEEIMEQNDRISDLVNQNGLVMTVSEQTREMPNKLANRIIDKTEDIMKFGESIFPEATNKKPPNAKQFISLYPTPRTNVNQQSRIDLPIGLGVIGLQDSPQMSSPGAEFNENSVPPIKEANTLVPDVQSSLSKFVDEKPPGLDSSLMNEDVFGSVNAPDNIQMFRKANQDTQNKNEETDQQLYQQKPAQQQQQQNKQAFNTNQNKVAANPSQNKNQQTAQQLYQQKPPQQQQNKEAYNTNPALVATPQISSQQQQNLKLQSKQKPRPKTSDRPKGPSIAMFDSAFQDTKSRIKTKTSSKATATDNAASLSTSKADANINGETSSSYSEKTAGLQAKVQELRHNTQNRRKQSSRNSYGWGNGQGYGYGKTSFGKGGGHAWAGDNYDNGLWNPDLVPNDSGSNHNRPQRQPSTAAGTSKPEATNQVTANQQGESNQPASVEGATNQPASVSAQPQQIQAPVAEASNPPAQEVASSSTSPQQPPTTQYQKLKPVAQKLPLKQAKVKETYNSKNGGQANPINEEIDNDEVKPMDKEQETNKKIEQKVDNKLEKPKGNKFAEQATGSGYGTGYGNKESWGQGGGYAWAGKAPPAGAPNPADFLQKPSGMPDFPAQAKGHSTGSGGFQNSGGVQSTGGEPVAASQQQAPGSQQAAATSQQPAATGQQQAPSAPAGPQQPAFVSKATGNNVDSTPQKAGKAMNPLLLQNTEKTVSNILPAAGKPVSNAPSKQQQNDTQTSNYKNNEDDDDDDSYAKTSAYKYKMKIQQMKTAQLSPSEDEYDR